VRAPRFRVPALRRHWRTAVAVAAAVAVVVSGIALAEGRGRNATADTRHSGGNQLFHGGTGTAAATPAATVPPGFRPWKTTVHGAGTITDEVRCVPDGDSVYCGGGGVVAARIRTADGTQVWRRTSPGVPEQGRHLVGVADGAVIGYHAAGSNAPWELDAVATADGKELWSAPLADIGAAFTGEAMDAVLLKSAVLSTDLAHTRIEARGLRTGRTDWTARFPAGSECLPVAAAGHAWAMCAPSAEVTTADITHLSLRTLDPATGALGPAVTVPGPMRPMGTDSSGALIGLAEHRKGDGFDGYARVVRVDPRTGRVTSVPVQRFAGTTPGLADGTLYFAGEDGEVTAVDPDTGRRLWTAQTSVEEASAPAAAHGVLYFGSASGRVVALDERSGRVRWSTFPRTGAGGGGSAGLEPRVAVAGGVLVTTAVGNVVIAFDVAKPPKAS
jgi:outer membrane protein assembly factor BamB